MLMCDILDELFSKCEMVSGFDCQVEAMQACRRAVHRSCGASLLFLYIRVRASLFSACPGGE